MTFRRALKSRFAWQSLMWQWRWMHAGDSLHHARLLAGDWWCKAVHIQPSLCWCGREWDGDICVTRNWRQDMEALAGEYVDPAVGCHDQN